MRRFSVLFSIAAALVCAAVTVQAQNVVVQLYPEFDLIGDQIEVVQGYYRPGEDPEQMMRVSFGIYDTGASVVTLNWIDQLFYGEQGVPIKVSGGAVADGVDGQVIGDVSQPGIIVSDGLHALNIDINNFDVSLSWDYQGTGDGPYAAVVPGVQMFVGTYEGSASLPTISGTPMHYSQNHAGDGAAYIDKQGYVFDLYEWFPNLISEPMPYYMADLEYVDSGTKLLTPTDPNVTGPIRIPLTMLGEDNYANPGNEITYTANPFVNVGLTMETDGSPLSVAEKSFLFDTGAMVSVISTKTAIALELDPNSGPHEIDIAGAAGASMTVYGHNLSLLELPYDNLDGTTGLLQFENVPVFVLDVGEGIDGILGMNLFNMAKEMLYDPSDPDGASLQLTFDLSGRDTLSYPDLTGGDNYALFSKLFLCPLGISIPGVAPVPEPGTFVLLAFGASIFLLRRIVRRRP